MLPALGAFQSIYTPPAIGQGPFFPLNHVVNEQNLLIPFQQLTNFSPECLGLSRRMLCPTAGLFRDGTLAAWAGLRGGWWQLPGRLCNGVAFRKQNLPFSLSAWTKTGNCPLHVVKQVMESFIFTAVLTRPARAPAAVRVQTWLGLTHYMVGALQD